MRSWHSALPLRGRQCIPAQLPTGRIHHKDCVIAKTEQFLAVLKDPSADKNAKARALKFVIHFVADLHQPLHDEDNGDNGGNTRHVIFDAHPDNLHCVWDTGLLQHISRNPAAFAAELESRITPRDEAEWQKGSIDDWAGRIAFQTIASRGDARRSRFQNKAKMPKLGSSLRPATAS